MFGQPSFSNSVMCALQAEENNDIINKGLVEGPTHLSKFIKREHLSEYLCTPEICLYSLFASDTESKISC